MSEYLNLLASVAPSALAAIKKLKSKKPQEHMVVLLAVTIEKMENVEKLLKDQNDLYKQYNGAITEHFTRLENDVKILIDRPAIRS